MVVSGFVYLVMVCLLFCLWFPFICLAFVSCFVYGCSASFMVLPLRKKTMASENSEASENVRFFSVVTSYDVMRYLITCSEVTTSNFT